MSGKMYFLLKTLLFLLCIYIKRVTATLSNASLDSYQRFGIADYGQKITFDGETAIKLECPIEDLIKVKKTVKADQKFFNKADQIRNRFINETQVYWTKEDGPIHRMNGNMIYDPKNGGSRDLTLIRVTLSDNGSYTCYINLTYLPKNTHKYYDLQKGAMYQLLVVPNEHLPDKKPTISRGPRDLLLDRGQNVTFTCETDTTLSTQSIRWFKSNCTITIQPNENECMNQFNVAVKKAENAFKSEMAQHILRDYIIKGAVKEEFRIDNTSDKDVAKYGCLVFNQRGYNICVGDLNFKDLFVESYHRTIAPNQIIRATTVATLNVSENSLNDNHSVSTTLKHFPEVATAASRDDIQSVYYTIFPIMIVFGLLLAVFIIWWMGSYIVPKKEQKLAQTIVDPMVGCNGSSDARQHLPSAICPDIYGLSKNDGFISGHLHQGNNHLMTQSICGAILDKEKNPSISSNSNSDEASWGQKSLSSNSDNCRAFYLHTSNTTATTVPMYDHPPSSGLLYSPVVRNACVSNPLYGYIQPDSDASKWAFPRRNLERLIKIGEGQFGEVWKYIARQKDGKESFVAVKQLKNRAGLGDRERLELIAEIEIMKSVSNHPNVIKLLNYCAEDYEPILLIMEYAEHGKLQTYLRDCRSVKKFNFYSGGDISPKVTSKELIKFSYHIAKGMEYVASQGIIHRDLASRNILVSKDKICKVADFGFARRITDDCAYERTTANPVPVKWMAPEALVENKFTSKSDVFSLGILMWEIVTLGATPYEYLTSTEVYKKVTTGGRLDRPVHCKDEFYSIMSSCWLQDPAQRPTFKELAFQLEKLLLSENDYIELDQYPEHAYYNILNTAEKEVVQITPPP